MEVVNKRLGVNRPAKITDSSIKKIALKAGILRTSKSAMEQLREEIYSYVDQLVKDAVIYTEMGRKQTITARAVIAALKKNNISYHSAEA